MILHPGYIVSLRSNGIFDVLVIRGQRENGCAHRTAFGSDDRPLGDDFAAALAYVVRHRLRPAGEGWEEEGRRFPPFASPVSRDDPKLLRQETLLRVKALHDRRVSRESRESFLLAQAVLELQ